ncbi:MAG: hypothetical protein ACOCV2_08100 [Persicimonas sp.]
MSDENPFDRLGLDPTMSREQLTERLRWLAERLPPDERDELRAVWRQLTLKDAERVEWAFFAHPRDEETEATDIDELRERVPTLVDRREPPPIEATVADALLQFGRPGEPSDTLRPEGRFGEVAREAAGHDHL